MAQPRSRLDVRTIVRVAGDVLRFVSSTLRPHAQLPAENLFLRKQLALYLERRVKPRRADDATRIALVALSRLIDWRRLLTVVKPKTLIRWHRRGFRLAVEIDAAWPTPIAGRPSALDRGHGRGKSHLGRGTDCVRTALEARDSGIAAYRSAIHAFQSRIEEWARLSGLELLRAQSRAGGARLRFLRHGDGDVRHALRLRGLGRGHAADPALERDRPSDGGVDGPAVPDGGARAISRIDLSSTTTTAFTPRVSIARLRRWG